MVTTIRTWSFDSNYTVAGANELEQAQSSCFRMLELLRGNVGVDASGAASPAGAWTVHSSSRGDGTVNLSGDDIAAPANIIFATGAVNHSWIVFRRTVGGKSLHVCFDFDTTSARDFAMYLFPSAPTTPGTATSRPLHTNSQLLSEDTFFGTDGFVPRTCHGWRASTGEFLFLFCVNGALNPYAAVGSFDLAGGEPILPWSTVGYFASGTIANGGLKQAKVSNSPSWATFWTDDSPVNGLVASSPLFGNLTAWVNGRSAASGSVPDAPIDFISNVASKAAYYGRLVDIRMACIGVPDNETQAGDTDLVRRVAVGDVWLPVRAAEGPLTL
jgi:hypothetical protein